MPPMIERMPVVSPYDEREAIQGELAAQVL
jgi:hypothetical protein